MSENPYASPVFATDAAPSQLQPKDSPNATQGQRFLNWFIDFIVLQVLGGAAGFVLGIVYASATIANKGAFTKEDEAQVQILGFILGLVVTLAYYTLMEALFQRTVGKFVTGTMVISDDGSRPSAGQILGRSFSRFIPFEHFSFLGGKEPRGWHDSLAGTRVIKTRK